MSLPTLDPPAAQRSITTDRRRIDYTPAPELLERAGALVAELRRVEVELGETLAAIESSRAHVEVSAGSVAHFATRLGLAPEEARRYRDLGRAIAVQPSVSARVLARALPTTRAAVLAPVLDGSGEPTSERDAGFTEAWGAELPEWVRIAERTGTRELREMVRRERTRRRTGDDIVDMTFHAKETTREHFERARVLASRKAGRRLTSDDTFRVVVEHYVDTVDPLAVEDGTRRVGPTSQRPGERYVPVAVRRAIRRRAQDRCEYPGCDERTFLEFAHRVPHRNQANGGGGGREEHDLFLLCWLHHTMFDARSVAVIGPTGNPAWIESGIGPGQWIVCTRRCPGGRSPETDPELRAVAEMSAAAARSRATQSASEGNAARPPP